MLPHPAWSEDRIALLAQQQVLEEKLLALTQNGLRTQYTAIEAHKVLMALDQFQEASMPFPPIDGGPGSRQRLVQDLRLRITQGAGIQTRPPIARPQTQRGRGSPNPSPHAH
jgi:hypothetical protein